MKKSFKMSSEAFIGEKLQTALNFKNEGNELYKAKEYKKAMRKYHNGILYLKGIDNDLHGTPSFLQAASVDPDSEKKISDQMELECINANISIYNNLAACLLASGEHNTEADSEKVIKYTDIVLELDDSNDKALFRKATALKSLRNYSDAKDTFELLKAVLTKKGLPISREIIKESQECQEALKDYEMKEKAMYQNMFGMNLKK